MLATAILLPSLKSLDPTLINWAIVLLTEAVSPEEQVDKNNQDLNNDNNNAASSDKTGHDKDGKYSKRRRSNVAVIIDRIVFVSSFLFCCLLLKSQLSNKPKHDY